MQANKLSKYNTQAVSTQQKIEPVEGKLILKSVAVRKPEVSPVVKSSSKARTSNFDFAGVAG